MRSLNNGAISLIATFLLFQTVYPMPYSKNYYSSSSGVSTGLSYPIAANDAFSSCTCDLTAGGCDAACCCDPDCSASVISAWQLNSNFCKDEINDQKILPVSQCFDRTRTASLVDLQDGLKVYGKNIRALFCQTTSSSREVISSFVEDKINAASAQDFNTTISSKAYYYKQTAIDLPETSSTNTASGYQALESLVGYRDNNGSQIYQNGKKVYLDRKSMYGQCDNVKNLRFLEPQNSSECGLPPNQLLTNNHCTQTLSPIVNAVNLSISADGSLVNWTTIYPGVQRKFSLNTNKEVNITDTTIFHQSQYDNVTCGCSNILLEAHYTAYYSDFSETFNTSFKIDNITLDLIYGDYVPATCQTPVSFTRMTSFNYKQSVYSRTNSGGPGYLKGMKLLTGYANTTDNGTYINMSSQGFQLRGADNQGFCYNMSTSVSTELNENYTEFLYYNDPTLLFKDSQLHGCKIQLNRTGLQEFCQKTQWQYLMLFQNFQLLKYIGRFGNSNPHFISDWILATVDSSKDKSDLKNWNWDSTTGTCQFPSSYFLQIFYTKINTKTKPQYQVVKATYYADTQNAWVFKKPSSTSLQDFEAIISVQYYEVDQDANFYAPKTPNPFQPLARNILYPFYVYGGANLIKVLSFTMLVLISFIYLI